MKGWIIYPRYVSLHADNAFEWMREEAARKGIGLEVVFFEELIPLPSPAGDRILYKGEYLCQYPDFVITRGYDIAVSRHFELRGIPVINSAESMSLAKDKLLSAQLFAQAGIPTPVTAGGDPAQWNYEALCSAFGSERFVVKRRDGSKGEDVYLIGDESQMREAVMRCGGNCIAQQFIATSSGQDLRVWVIGGRAVACVRRYSENSFKANFSQGGKAEVHPLTPEIKSLAEKSAGVCGLEFAGVDLLFAPDGYTVCEVNGNAGFRTLSLTGGNEIPAVLFGYIAEKYGSRKEKNIDQ